MKHRVAGRKLGKTSSHKKAMLLNMASSLLKHERVKTTLAKAKELRRVIEPIITRAKVESLHNKRLLLRKVKNRKLINKLFENIAPRYTNRNGGYTRIIRLSMLRKGDNSKMAFIELVEEQLYPSDKKKSSKKDKRQKDSKDKSSIKTDSKDKKSQVKESKTNDIEKDIEKDKN